MIIEYDEEEASKVIIPIETELNIKVFISYKINTNEKFLQNLIFRLYEGKTNIIDISVDSESLPSYISASFSTSSVAVDISKEYTMSTNASLIVTVNENAPAFVENNIRIKASAREFLGRFGLTRICNVTEYEDIKITPGYIPLISIELPKGNFMEIDSMDTADFEIKVENLGNAPTEISFKILDCPDVLRTAVIESIVLGVYESKIVHLRIKPNSSLNFRETITLELTPSYYRNPALSGKTYLLNFTVSNNESIVGENNVDYIIFIPIITISILFIIIYIYFKSKSK